MRLRTRSCARLFSTAAITAAATLVLARSPAIAQYYYFWGGERAPRVEAPPEPRRVARPQRQTRKKISRPAAGKDGAAAARTAKAEAPKLDRPLFLIASIADQHVSIYNRHGLVARSAISTGVAGHPTPKGIFSIIGRERFHRSNIYSGAPMPFMQRVTWSGIAMHLGVVPGHPASHGCIRLPAAFAAKMWGMTRIGERVVISPHDVTPTEFEHPLLPAPKMRASAEPGEDGPSSQERAAAPEKAERQSDPGAAPAAAKPAPAADPQQAFTVDPGPSAAHADPLSDELQQKAAPPKADADAPAASSQQPAEAKADAADKPSEAAKTANPPDAQQPSLDAADAAAVSPSQERAEQTGRDSDRETADADKNAPAADSQQESHAAADSPADKPSPAEPPKDEASATRLDTSEPVATAPRNAIAERPKINPHQYALKLKAKTAADVVAAKKAVQELTADVAAKRKEAARAAAELGAAEAAHTSALSKADRAAASYDAATAAIARQQEPAEAAERSAVAGDRRAKAKADSLTRAYGKALLAQDAALLAKANASASLDEATAKLEPARTAAAAKDAESAAADRRLEEARAAVAVAVAADRDAQKRVMPVSVLISKKDRRIYVRQGLSPVFDAPVEIRDPDTPLGSHLFIATAADDDGSLKWSVVTMPVRADRPVERRKNLASADTKTDVSWSWRTTGASPAEALERIDIPKDVRDLIADRLWTGASLIVSDQPVSGETGADGTDLTIKFR